MVSIYKNTFKSYQNAPNFKMLNFNRSTVVLGNKIQ